MSLLDTIFSALFVQNGVEFIQRKTIELVGGSVSVEDDPVNLKTVITIDMAGVDGDRLPVDFVPTYYTRTEVPDVTDEIEQLTSNLAGIDNKLGELTNTQWEVEAGTTLTLSEADRGKSIRFTSNSPITVTLPSAVIGAPGFTVELIPWGTGQITVAGDGFTPKSGGSELKSARQYGPMFVRQVTVSDWLVTGEKAT